MYNNELNNKILKNVRNRIVMSNLESEEKMKINKRKHNISLIAVIGVLLTGSFATVNAVTDNRLAEGIKDTIKVIFVKDNKEQEIEGKTHKDSNGDIIETYEYNNGDTEIEIDVNKSNLESENLETEHKITEDGEIETVIKNQEK